MAKKKVYIISHAHWDREWYMPFEQHHMRLIELIDDLLTIFKSDPTFDSFHLDGQTIILDDYLAVRPERKQELQEAITAGKLRIGPFYILQDAFLISPESNIRNMLIGRKESEKWKTPTRLGYFPDTFGNMGQTPQLMQQASLPAVAFGRGVQPVGFDNQLEENRDYSSQYSEMWWEGPDKTQVFGLLFANWYSNGNEIPSTQTEAQLFWEQKLADAEKFASTNHLLMMNGVDHQPVQKDLAKAIELANKLFPEYEFIHSNFEEYLSQLIKDLPKNLGKVKGELTSQETDGWFTLANTASTRVYLKQWNTKVERQLENITEPLATMAYSLTKNYPHDQLDYAWKLLLQNHTHDGICGCSVDSVHREMMTRFEKAYEVGQYLASDALETLIQNIDTAIFPEKSLPFIVFNTTGYRKTGIANVAIEIDRKYFNEGSPNKLKEKLVEEPTPNFQVINQDGQVLSATISKAQVNFDYDLPKDRFRVPYMTKIVTVEIPLKDFPAVSWQTFALQEIEKPINLTHISMIGATKKDIILENEFLHVQFKQNGLLRVVDKKSNTVYNDLLLFEDTGDIGNEYIYKQPEDTKSILSSDFPAKITINKDTEYLAQIKITQTMKIPVSADDLLVEEQQAMIDFRNRQAKRSDNLAPLTIETLVTMERDSPQLQFTTTLDNQMKDHRLRVLFETNIHKETHEADSIYEVVTRPNQTSDQWKNPTNPQHQQAFVNLHSERFGMTISNYGLNEYEILREKGTIALTLLRSVGELGDWGYFPTPEAQCLSKHVFHYGLECHNEPTTRYKTYQNAYASQIPFTVAQATKQQGKLPESKQWIIMPNENIGITAMKNSEDDHYLIIRGFNLSQQETEWKIKVEGTSFPVLLNLLEQPQQRYFKQNIDPYEIQTLGFTYSKEGEK